MALKYPVSAGNISVPGNWNGGTKPVAGDWVHLNGLAMTLDEDLNLLYISTAANAPAVAGGTLSYASATNRFINAQLLCGTSMVIAMNGGGDLTITGNVNANTTMCINKQGGGVLTVVGDVFGGTGSGLNGAGVHLNTATATNIIGNVTGGLAGYGVNNSNLGAVTITGNVTGGNAAGVQNAIQGTITINGNVFAANGNGVVNASTGFVTVNGTVYASAVASAVVGVVVGGTTVVRSAENHTNGYQALQGFVKYANSTAITVRVTKQNGTQVTLTDPSAVVGLLPVPGDVREGVSFNTGLLTGTLKVPSPSNVRKGVPTDNTVGTADITVDDFLTGIQNSTHPFAERLKIVSTVDTTGDQLQDFLNT